MKSLVDAVREVSVSLDLTAKTFRGDNPHEC